MKRLMMLVLVLAGILAVAAPAMADDAVPVAEDPRGYEDPNPWDWQGS